MPRSIQQLVQEGKLVAEDWEEGFYLFEFFEFQCICVSVFVYSVSALVECMVQNGKDISILFSIITQSPEEYHAHKSCFINIC